MKLGPSGEHEASADTPWRGGRLDSRAGPKKVLFGRMYEDVAIERAAFAPGARVFCIASAGCTALGLSDRHEVVACDINPAQLAYAEERIAGAPARAGTAERVMGFGRSLARLAGWSPQALRDFVDLTDTAAQTRFWHEHLDTWRFRTGFGALMSVLPLRAVYRGELLGFLPARFGSVLRSRMERCFERHPNATNPYARALFLGEGPPAAEARSDAHRIRLVPSDAASFLESCPGGSFDGFALSNILDGASASYRARLFAAVEHAASPDAVVVLRSFAEPEEPRPTNRAVDDRSMLWGIVDVRRVTPSR